MEHKFSAKAYRSSNLAYTILMFVITLFYEFLFVISCTRQDFLYGDPLIRFFIAQYFAALTVMSFFMGMYYAKRSDVHVEKDSVIYMVRRSSLFGIIKSCNIHYHFTGVQQVKESLANELIVKGKIMAVYYEKDGKTELRRREFSRFRIPPYYEDMKGIGEALERIQQQGQTVAAGA